jgi:hypothetical protein
MSQDRAARIGLPAHDCKDKTTRAKQKGEDKQNRTCLQGSKTRTARMGQPVCDRQNKTARTEVPEQDISTEWQKKMRQRGQDKKERTVEKQQNRRTAR